MPSKIDKNCNFCLLLYAKYPSDCSTYATETQELWCLLESHREKIRDIETSPVCIERTHRCLSAVILTSSG